MPFDGSEFRNRIVETPAARPPFPVAESPTLWTRLRQRVWGFLTPRPEQPPPSLDMLTVHLLVTARSLIEDEQNWVQHDYETRDGRFCAVGALRYAARFARPPEALGPANRLLLETARERGFTKIEKMNDRSSHERVLAAFDEAIRRAKG